MVDKNTAIKTTLKLGIALGSGSARGWSHIGVLNALAEEGIHSIPRMRGGGDCHPAGSVA